MLPIKSALIWAAAIMLMALASAAGWIDRDAARTMLIIMPVLAIISMRHGTRCRTGRA